MTYDHVRLLEADPELGDGLAPVDLDRARRHLTAPVRHLGTGRWAPADEVLGTASLGLLVLDGLIVRDLDLGRRSSTEVLGAGDLMRPWDVDGEMEELPVAVRWSVLQETRFAVLDHRFLQMAVRFPAIIDALMVRGLRRHRWLSLRLVVNQLVRLDDRLLLAMWALADRWGRVTPDGILVPVPLTHSALARLVGARRPSVTSALGDLARDGLVERTEDGWLLRGDPATLVEPITARLLSSA
ncbi:MAG TPA: Crp/Fnr family transcriptional regulator [Baekduia sp.]|nr:Crp/Fnr family transcriptional regulator [Baekduia sp.]